MICTSVTHEGKKLDVLWKRGKSGPKIGYVYHHNTEKPVREWKMIRDDLEKALRSALPNKKLNY